MFEITLNVESAAVLLRGLESIQIMPTDDEKLINQNVDMLRRQICGSLSRDFLKRRGGHAEEGSDVLTRREIQARIHAEVKERLNREAAAKGSAVAGPRGPRPDGWDNAVDAGKISGLPRKIQITVRGGVADA